MKLFSPLFLTLCLLITAAVLLTPVVPLGVTGTAADGSSSVEWVWNRHRNFNGPADLFDRLLAAVLAGGVLFGVSRFGVSRVAFCSQIRLVGSYTALIAAAWLWGQQLQQTTPLEHRESKPLWVLYDPSSSGYFFEAAFRMDSAAQFLARYEGRMRQGDVLHVGTHPPGLFLLSKACLELCDASPALTSWLIAFQDERQREAFRLLEREARFAPPLRTAQLAALQLLSLLSSLAIVLTIVPLAFLGHMFFTREVTWRVCAVWATLPCLAVFTPKSDVLFAFTGTVILAAGVWALLQASRWSWVFAMVAGTILWCGLMLSLAHLPVVVVLVGVAIVRALQTRLATLRRDVLMLATVAGTVAALCVVWHAATHCNMFAVWSWNLANHAGFYDQFSRTWWKWLLVNPVELSFAVGLPVFVLAVVGTAAGVRSSLRRDSEISVRSPAGAGAAFCTAAGATLLMLWLSGKNQGEAARLWCFLTPWLVLAAGVCVSRRPSAPCPHWMTPEDRLLLTQIVISIVTVSQVSGFSF